MPAKLRPGRPATPAGRINRVKKNISIRPDVWALAERLAELANERSGGKIHEGGGGMHYPSTVIEYLILAEAHRLGIHKAA